MRASKAYQGKRFVKLTLGEARTIAGAALDLLQYPNDLKAVLTAQDAITGLVHQFDIVLAVIETLDQECKRFGIPMDVIDADRRHREPYRGLNTEESHKLRRFKHGEIIRDEAKTRGINPSKHEVGKIDVFGHLRDIPLHPTSEINALIDITRGRQRQRIREQDARRKAAKKEAESNIHADLNPLSRLKLAEKTKWQDREIARWQREATEVREELTNERESHAEEIEGYKKWVVELQAKIDELKTRVEWRDRDLAEMTAKLEKREANSAAMIALQEEIARLKRELESSTKSKTDYLKSMVVTLKQQHEAKRGEAA